jgi:hypothetical protein
LFWNPTNNYLGIGTSNPNFPIDVESSVSHTFSGGYGWLNTGGASSSGGNVNGYFSLYAASRIASQEFDAVSDARIKNVIGPSDTALDLATLKKLKITDYRYIEVVEKGNQRKKGVIAQEVEKVYPDAVRIISNFVPSVYANGGGLRLQRSQPRVDRNRAQGARLCGRRHRANHRRRCGQRG